MPVTTTPTIVMTKPSRLCSSDSRVFQRRQRSSLPTGAPRATASRLKPSQPWLPDHAADPVRVHHVGECAGALVDAAPCACLGSRVTGSAMQR
jgi:hypothetical protein